MARLRRNVHLVGEQGRSFVFGPGSDVPEWAAKRITNPAAWDTAPAAAEEPRSSAETLEEPPRSGPGSNKAAWVAYAESKGVTITDDMGREDIIEAATRE